MEAPLLRVSRPVSACSRCRNAKTKCDGKLPACTACERSNRAAECSSANDQFAKGKERSYVASLESRVERLEKQIAQLRQRRASTTMDIGIPRLMGSNVLSPSSKRRVQHREASDVDELVSDFGYLSVNATARDFHGFTKEMSFARLVLSTSSVDPMPRFASNSLPLRNHARVLIQQCLDEIFSLYPVFTDIAVYGSFEAVYQRASTPLNWWNTCMTLAIALMSRSHAKDDALYRDAVRHASNALENAESVLQPGSIAGLQAILLLVIYSTLDPSHFNSWYLIGVASRVMVDLGLHQEPAEDVKIKESHLMLRRRIFYCVYTLDRAVSIANIRAFSFSDDSASVEGPGSLHPSLSPFDPPAELYSHVHVGSGISASQLLKLRQLQSAWYQRVFQSNREAISEPWQTRCNDLSEMYSWMERLSATTSAPERNMFLSEVFSSSILLLCPLSSGRTLCSYGKALVFDFSVRFSETMLNMCGFSQSYNYCMSHDVLRTLFVGQTLLNLLQESATLAFSVTDPVPPSAPSSFMSPPGIQRRNFTGHVNEAISCITRLDQIVDSLRRRFGYSSTYKYDEYSYKSHATLQILRARRQPQEVPVLAPAQGQYIGSAVPIMPPYRDPNGVVSGYLPP